MVSITIFFFFQRASLLETLQQYQASSEELSKLTSIASIQTKGLKRHFFEEAHPEKIKPKKNANVPEGLVRLNSISGAKRKKLMQTNAELKSNDPNIVGFDSSGTSESEDETSLNESDSDIKDAPDAMLQMSSNNNVINEDVTLVEQYEAVPAIEIKDDAEKCENENSKKIKALKTLPSGTPAVYVHVMRNDEIQKARLKLPILAEEQQIMETINENSIIVLAGLY